MTSSTANVALPAAAEQLFGSIELDDTTTRDEWRQLLAGVNQAHGSLGWIVGDLIVWGESKYEDALEDVADILESFSRETLANWRHVVLVFPPDRRSSALTLSHHLEAAYLPGDEPYKLIDAAEAGAWPKSKVREVAAARRKELDEAGKGEPLPLDDDTDEPDDTDDAPEYIPPATDVMRSRFLDIVAPLRHTPQPNVLLPRDVALALATYLETIDTKEPTE